MHTKTIGLAFVVVFTCVLFALGSRSFAQDFSGNLVIQEKGRSEHITSKIFVKGNKMRQETLAGGINQITIIRPDKGVIWMVMPEGRMYMETPYQAGDKKFEKWSSEKEKNAKYLGKETVSGLSCKKYQITEGGEKMHVWISEKSPFPVKMDYRDGIMEYKNIKFGSVRDSLFEIPSGYQKMSFPMVPGGMGFPK